MSADDPRAAAYVDAMFDAIAAACHGRPVSEFMLSFADVRQIVELRQRAEQAEAQIIPVADRERALELACACGENDLSHWDCDGDDPGCAECVKWTEARRLLRLEP